MRSFSRALLVSAATLGAAAAAEAQTQSLGDPVAATGSYAGEDSLDRAALYTQSAFTAPRGRYGFSVQAQGASAKDQTGSETLEFRESAAVFSAFYGLTDAVTIGAGLPYASQTLESSMFADELTDDGLGDMQLFGRLRAYRSATGMTRLALGAAASLPTGQEGFGSDDPRFELGAAMTHRVNRLSFHVAPALRMVKHIDMSYDINLAATFAATPKLALSFEALNRFEGQFSADAAERTRLNDLGAGMRYNAVENLVLDLGLRINVANNFGDGVDTSMGQVNLGFSWLF